MDVSREFILRITRQCGFVSEKLEKTTATLNRIMKQIEELDKEGNLTIPYLKNVQQRERQKLVIGNMK
ncbi:hypothetical protein ODV99_08120 [Enterococcus faecium]|nr:hypothetical protein [Enterococcus faecium]